MVMHKRSEPLGLGDVNTRLTQLASGVRESVPFLLSAFPMGVIGGALGVASGLSIGQTIWLSALLNSGTAQFLAFKLIQEQAGLLVIMLTVLILSLRMVMYGLALRTHTRDLSVGWRLILGFGLIDAVYMAVSVRLKSSTTIRFWQWYYVGVSGVMYLGWLAATVLGAFLGNTVTDTFKTGLDFPLVAVFGAMLASTITNKTTIAVCIITAILALGLNSLPYHLGLVISALLGASVGAYFHTRNRRISSAQSLEK